MIALNGRSVTLLDGELKRREADNRAYMLRLSRENLMRNYLLEAGLWTAPFQPEGIHAGWESAVCQLRGHFTGHYLSACAMIWELVSQKIFFSSAVSKGVFCLMIVICRPPSKIVPLFTITIPVAKIKKRRFCDFTKGIRIHLFIKHKGGRYFCIFTVFSLNIVV